jgi:hypothetical protein
MDDEAMIFDARSSEPELLGVDTGNVEIEKNGRLIDVGDTGPSAIRLTLQVNRL